MIWWSKGEINCVRKSREEGVSVLPILDDNWFVFNTEFMGILNRIK